MVSTRLICTVFVFSQLFLVASAVSQDAPPPAQTLFTNVNVFNGTDDRLYENHSVLVEGNLIQAHICTNTSDDLDWMHIDITSAFAIANNGSDGRIQVAICDSCGSLATPRLRVLSGYVACGCSDVPVFHLSYAVKKGRKRRK